MAWFNDCLIINDNTKLKAYGEHNGKSYLAYFNDIPKDVMYFKFASKWRLEEFLYTHGIEKFDYKSSNGNIITKVWEYIPKELEEWKEDNFRTAKEKKQGYPDKYSWDDWRCGHYIKEK